MKANTQTFIVIILLFVSSVVCAGNSNEIVTVASTQEIRTEIQKQFVKDMTGESTYLYKNNISRLNDEVKLLFKIDQNGKVILTKVLCDNLDASGYAKYIVENMNVHVEKIATDKLYGLNVKLEYKAY